MLKDVAEHFKALSATDRNVESLKILWKRLRSELKKKDAVLKRRFRKTGGGSTENSTTLSLTAEKVNGLLLEKQVTLLLKSHFDPGAPCQSKRKANDFMQLVKNVHASCPFFMFCSFLEMLGEKRML